KQVRHHNNAPLCGVKEGHCTWLSGQDNYPQRPGTRPTKADASKDLSSTLFLKGCTTYARLLGPPYHLSGLGRDAVDKRQAAGLREGTRARMQEMDTHHEQKQSPSVRATRGQSRLRRLSHAYSCCPGRTITPRSFTARSR